jgi:hypothetical protein
MLTAKTSVYIYIYMLILMLFLFTITILKASFMVYMELFVGGIMYLLETIFT